MPDRRQGDRRQGERRETPENTKSFSLSFFIITIISLIVIFIIALTCIILNYQNTISNLNNNQVTDLTLLPTIEESTDLSDNLITVPNLTLTD